MAQRVFSGVQPSGQITLGNYITMKNFVDLQEDKDCFYCIVDMHSITVPQDPEELKRNSLQLTALYMALGINHNTSTLFLQSTVPAHAELSWILQCHTYMGELNRMTQFKEKSKGKEVFSTALFTYPVLMAADILLYDTHFVPVGDDQKQHLELARDIAIRMNNKYEDMFVVPEPMISEFGARIMSLDDPTTKMSKSNPNEHSKICLLDSPDKIKKTLMRATTDSDAHVSFDEENKPGISNLMIIHSKLSNKSLSEIELMYDGLGYGQFKKDLVELVTDSISPIQKRYHDILDSGEVFEALKIGKEKAELAAAPVLKRVKDKVGFISI